MVWALAYVAVAAIVFTAFEDSVRRVISNGYCAWFCWSVHALLSLLWPLPMAVLFLRGRK